MIIGVTGLPGAGKSYFVTGEILAWLRKDSAARVISNFHPSEKALKEFKGRWVFGLWEDMLNAEINTLCVVDEANMWFSSRSWKDQSATDLAAFKQSRKNGVSLWWCDQHEARVDVAIREVTHWYYRIERFYCFSACSIEDPSSGKKAGRLFRLRSPKVWEYYDSYERIGNRVGEGYGRGRAAVPIRAERDTRLYRYADQAPCRVEYHRGPILGRIGQIVELPEPKPSFLQIVKECL